MRPKDRARHVIYQLHKYEGLYTYIEQAINDALTEERNRVDSKIQQIAEYYGNKHMPVAELMTSLQHVLSNTEED